MIQYRSAVIFPMAQTCPLKEFPVYFSYFPTGLA